MKSICLSTCSLIGVLSLYLLTSCIKDDLSGCNKGGGSEREFNLYFSFTPLSYAGRGFDPAEVEEIRLFVFDEKGKYVREEIDESPELSADYYIPVRIVPGTYDFVVWGNVSDCYRISTDDLIEGETTKEELLLLFETGSANRVTEEPHPLFFGDLKEIKVLNRDEQRFTMPITKNTYTIHVSTRGLEESASSYSLQITDRGNSYTFDNSYASSTEVSYITSCRKDLSGQPYGSLTVQRLLESRQYARLKLEDTTTNETIYEDNLIQLIQLLRQVGVSVDFTRIYEYEIELDFSPNPNPTPGSDTYILAAVTINGWRIILNEYEM